MLEQPPESMRRVCITASGGPEVLVLDQDPLPFPGEDEVRVRLHAASINHLDIWIRNGTLPLPLPHTPGCDGAGVVDAVGDGVSGWRAGDRVVICPALGCGHCPACTHGDTQLCPEFAIVGVATPGCYADYVTLPARNLLALPDSVSFEQAAALPVAGMTSWHLLMECARLQPGELVLVHGGGSGLGTFAIQIARLAGCRVLATCGGAEKCEHALDLGAELAIDHSSERFVERVQEISRGRGVDVVFDHVGAALFSDNMASLATGGRLLVCGTTTGGDVEFNLRNLFTGQQSIIGARLGGHRAFSALLAEVVKGRIRPVIDGVFPLEQAAPTPAWASAATLARWCSPWPDGRREYAALGCHPGGFPVSCSHRVEGLNSRSGAVASGAVWVVGAVCF
ncbi:MAG: zinc-binding dehydrogenase [Leptospirillia bacterium]